ncbi:response regulator [Pedobacter psychroterrae]|uniref:Response regulator transcription factor n=1 Tax=Pedobacter psychroterrae TaxID=2530453 RepID=A0A4R0NKZ8_9SPHI|nr:response regulator transcription factor [Pedobacter psychroterrae]TCD00173.1 response regulator transcription factor [Pedobacter psychroterrae]
MKQLLPNKIFIVDDHQLVIDGIRSLLADAPQYTIGGFSQHPEEVLAMLETHPVDILLTDISMPGMSGIELTRLVKKKYPHIKIIAISMHGESAVVKEMLDAGISGYILKNTGKKELLDALEKVLEGSTYFGDAITREILNTMNHKDGDQRLTNREIEIIKLIEGERSNKQISSQLFISERTVETHRKNIFRKTGTQSVIGLLKYAYKHKLI